MDELDALAVTIQRLMVELQGKRVIHETHSHLA